MAVLTIGAVGSILAAVVVAQQKPVAAMFGDDQKRGETIALSFATAEIEPTASAGFPLHLYLTAGDLVRAFDRADFRPDAAIVPTPIPNCSRREHERRPARAHGARSRAVNDGMHDVEEADRHAQEAIRRGPPTVLFEHYGVDSSARRCRVGPCAGQPGAFPEPMLLPGPRPGLLSQRSSQNGFVSRLCHRALRKGTPVPDGACNCRRRCVAPCHSSAQPRPARSRKTPHSKANAL